MKDRRRYDYSKLSGRIKEKCGTQELFAKRIGRSHTYISSVMNGKAYFNQGDIETGIEVLEIPSDEIGIYFFNKKVHKNGTKEN